MNPLRIAFAGTPEFAAVHLQALLGSEHELVAVLTQPDRPAGRGKKPQASAVKLLAEKSRISVLQPRTLRGEEVAAELAALQLDVLVVVAYGLLLPETILSIPRYGCVNVHGSLLPRWRGAAPIQRCIAAGDTISGVTIMQMDAGMDTGPMLAKATCPVDASTTSGDLYAGLTELGPSLLLNVLADVSASLANAEAQDDAAATKAPKISKEEALLDWHVPAEQLARWIHALNPNPGGYSFLDDKRVKIWRATAIASQSQHSPGTILPSAEGELHISCGKGILAARELQLPGGRPMEAKDLLLGNGELLAPGKRFCAQHT